MSTIKKFNDISKLFENTVLASRASVHGLSVEDYVRRRKGQLIENFVNRCIQYGISVVYKEVTNRSGRTIRIVDGARLPYDGKNFAMCHVYVENDTLMCRIGGGSNATKVSMSEIMGPSIQNTGLYYDPSLENASVASQPEPTTGKKEIEVVVNPPKKEIYRIPTDYLDFTTAKLHERAKVLGVRNYRSTLRKNELIQIITVHYNLAKREADKAVSSK